MKVLIVEDSVELAQSLSSFFDLDGHSTYSVSDLKTAEDIIAVSHFDIILLDIMLPDGSGEEILKMMRIKKNDTPVIIMTAKSEISNKINFLDIGADDYITKPFDFSELEARCRAVLRRKTGKDQFKLEYGNAVLLPMTASLEIDGKVHKLRNRELRLLEIFFNSPEIILSKDQLFDRLFLISETVSDNTIEVYIARVRKKLELSNIKIDTIKNIGYMLIKK